MKPSKDPTGNEKYTKIIDLKPFMKNVNIIFIVLEKGAVTKTKEGFVIAHALVADGTASVNLSLWDTTADWLQPGDIIRARGAYSTIFKHSLSLYCGRFGTIERIGEFTMVFTESPNISQYQWVNDTNNPNQLLPVPPGQPVPSGHSLVSGSEKH